MLPCDSFKNVVQTINLYILQSLECILEVHLHWASSNLVAIQCAWNLDPSVHCNATGDIIFGTQCISSGLQVAFQWWPIMQINTGSPLEHHWVLPSASVVPVASSVLVDPAVFHCVPIMQINTGLPMGHHWLLASASSGISVYSWLQWSSSLVCPIVFQCTDRIWFGGH